MPSRRDLLKAGGLGAAGVLAGGAARYGSWSPAPLDAPEGTWLQPQYDQQNTSYIPDASPPTEPPDVARAHDVAESVNALAVDAERLYVGADHAVYAFEDGNEYPRWDRAAATYRLAATGDTVVAAGETAVSAFAATNGDRLWRRSRAAYTAGLLVDRQTAYVGWSDACVAYDLADGGRRWSLPVTSDAAVGFDGDRLLVAGSFLHAYEPRGSLRGVLGDAPVNSWTYEGAAVQPVVAGEYALVGEDGGPAGATTAVTAVDAAGRREWRTELGNNARRIATDGDRAYAVSMRYGEPEGDVQFSDTTTLHALDVATGDELWAFQRGGWFCQPVVADGAVYVGEYGGPNGNGNLHALDAETGDRLWTHDANGVNVLAAVGESLLAGTDDGRVLELR